eukprot:COSAG05_NODE_3656_length_1926_cov_9.477285_2_plen_54_part_00
MLSARVRGGQGRTAGGGWPPAGFSTAEKFLRYSCSYRYYYTGTGRYLKVFYGG